MLYKPATPAVLPEESTGSSTGAQRIGGKAPRVRDLGGVEPARVQMPAGHKPRVESATNPAYKAAYFNKDISGVHDVNLAARAQRVLRGAVGATDLRKVVLPPGMGPETPEPAMLRGASDLMGLDGSFELSLASLLGRQGAWARGAGVTVEMLRARLAQLEAMVQARRQALLRMARGRATAASSSVTLEHAHASQGAALEGIDDVVEAGRSLVGRTASQAEGMHRRIAKALGIKR